VTLVESLEVVQVTELAGLTDTLSARESLVAVEAETVVDVV